MTAITTTTSSTPSTAATPRAAPRKRRMIAHPATATKAPTDAALVRRLLQTPTPTPTPTPLDPQAIWRQETARKAREIHEKAYFLYVVCPLTTRGYPRPHAQTMLIPGRRFRWDFCFLEARLAVEVQGQIWHKGGHTTGRGLTRDAAKANELACIGWRCLFITPEMIEDGTALDVTERALRHAGLRGAA